MRADDSRRSAPWPSRASRNRRPHAWNIAIRVLHWITVLVLAGLLVSGWRSGAHGISNTHLTLGVVLLAVVAARLVARFVTAGPAPLTHVPLLRFAWRINQLLLYLSVLATIFSGLAAFSPHPFMPQAKLFGAVALPWILPLTPGSRQLAAWGHGWLVWIMLGVIAVHVAAVIGHALISGPAVLRRITRGA